MKPRLLCLVLLLLSIPTSAQPCSVSGMISPQQMVRDADAIVRAAAVDYARPPAEPDMRTTGEPDSRVRFRTVEVLKGAGFPSLIELPGYLVERDDFNEGKIPYTFVRPGGRSGSCFANSYRRNAQFLLMLKKRADGAFTVNWYALGPVNEQLRTGDDPWLEWVRDHVGKVE
jgi:hypothetical protein